jgi:hypothetical protein
MENVPLCRFATSPVLRDPVVRKNHIEVRGHHLDFAALRHDVLKRFKRSIIIQSRGGLDLDFMECGICRLRYPINTAIGNGRGPRSGSSGRYRKLSLGGV